MSRVVHMVIETDPEGLRTACHQYMDRPLWRATEHKLHGMPIFGGPTLLVTRTDGYVTCRRCIAALKTAN